MKYLRFFVLGLCLLGLVSCNTNDVPDDKTTGGVTLNPEIKTIDLNLFNNSKDLRFSSYESGTESSVVHYLKQIAPYDDTYKVKANKYTTVEIYDKDGKEIKTIVPTTKESIDLKKNGTYTAGERLSITNISFEGPVEIDFYKRNNIDCQLIDKIPTICLSLS